LPTSSNKGLEKKLFQFEFVVEEISVAAAQIFIQMRG
jgi:hypothetical protein